MASTGKVLALHEWVGRHWFKLIAVVPHTKPIKQNANGNQQRASCACRKNCLLTPPPNNFLIALALRSSFAGRRHNQLIMYSWMKRLPAWDLRFELRSNVKFPSWTNYSPFFGRPQELVDGGGGREVFWCQLLYFTTHSPLPHFFTLSSFVYFSQYHWYKIFPS
jgi:hypothetical protein